jgi:ubiquinone/menaquinone biosynthesis C-methylase UbiE
MDEPRGTCRSVGLHDAGGAHVDGSPAPRCDGALPERGTIADMSDEEERQAARYDEIAGGYARWWAPVLAPSASALLERLDPVVAGGASDVLDVGVGTGNLALPALERWPGVHVTGIDASSEMLEAALAFARALPDQAAARFTGRVAFAGELPFEDRTFDVAMSSFVLQLVPSRPKALREIRRVLRPGGTLAYVTWLTDRTPFAPDRIFDALLLEAGFNEEGDEPDSRQGDIPSITTAAAELRRAGFRAVAAESATLSHAFTVPAYIAFLTEFDEVTLFEDEMTRSERRRFLATLRERLMVLPEDELVFRAPIVYASGIRSDS